MQDIEILSVLMINKCNKLMKSLKLILFSKFYRIDSISKPLEVKMIKYDREQSKK